MSVPKSGAPRVGDVKVDRVIDALWNEIQKLRDAVNPQPDTSKQRDSTGKPGDIRLLKLGPNDYRVGMRFREGWVITKNDTLILGGQGSPDNPITPAPLGISFEVTPEQYQTSDIVTLHFPDLGSTKYYVRGVVLTSKGESSIFPIYPPLDTTDSRTFSSVQVRVQEPGTLFAQIIPYNE